MSELPKGWVNLKLGDLIELKYGKSLPAKQRSGVGFPVYGSNGVVGLHTEALVSGGGLIVGRKGSFGEVHLCEDDFSPIDTTYFVDSFPSGTMKYWYYQLKNLPLTKLNRSTAIPGLNRDDAYSQDVLLPPDAEQKRIVEKLDEVLAQVDTIKARLDGIPDLLKRFRQSVLASAVSGKLTEEWRGESAYKYEDLEYSFPICWNKTSIADLIDYVTSGSRGWAKYYAGEGSLFIRSQDINTDELFIEDAAYVQLPEKIEGRRTKVELNDILVTITGANVTKCARIKLNLDDAYVSQHVALIRLNDIEHAPFVELNLKALNSGRKQLTDMAYGGGKPGLNLQNIKDVKIALPRAEEQNEIVRLVDQYFAFADTIEAQVKKVQARVDSLTQSILAKAFRGELVPQDPNDEPADKLLERIAEARADAEALAKAAKKAEAAKKKAEKAAAKG